MIIYALSFVKLSKKTGVGITPQTLHTCTIIRGAAGNHPTLCSGDGDYSYKIYRRWRWRWGWGRGWGGGGVMCGGQAGGVGGGGGGEAGVDG